MKHFSGFTLLRVYSGILSTDLAAGMRLIAMKNAHSQPNTAAREPVLHYIADHLQPGEKLVYIIRRSRGAANIAQTALIYALWAVIVFFLMRLLSRMLVSSYILPWRVIDSSDLITLNLVLGVLPFVMLFGLVHHFICTFYIELALTDRRIFGRVCGAWALCPVEFKLHEVENLYAWLGYLCIQSGSRVALGGFSDLDEFIHMFRSIAPTVRAQRSLAPRSSIS